MDRNKVCELLDKISEKNPLVHNITNIVVANFSANGLLAIGASPVMAHVPEEAADMAKLADAVVLNLGNLVRADLEAMILAGKTANEQEKPVVLDPVGVGSTPFRLVTAEKLLGEFKADIIRGNAAEIANLIGERWEVKGVDAGSGGGNAVEVTEKAAQKLDCIVISTGETDVISDGATTYLVRNGDPLLAKVTGTGCLLSAVVGAFAAVGDERLEASVSALVFYGVAAERAAEKTRALGNGSFQIEFLNQLSLLRGEEILKYCAFEKL